MAAALASKTIQRIVRNKGGPPYIISATAWRAHWLMKVDNKQHMFPFLSETSLLLGSFLFFFSCPASFCASTGEYQKVISSHLFSFSALQHHHITLQATYHSLGVHSLPVPYLASLTIPTDAPGLEICLHFAQPNLPHERRGTALRDCPPTHLPSPKTGK